MGMAAMLPGMQKMLDLMQKQVDEFRDALNGLSASPRRVEGATKLGRPRKNVAAIQGRASSGWPADPAERSAEMKRRRAVAEKKKNAKLHPRDKSHPEHAAWVAKMKKVQQKFWKGLTVAQRKERIAKLAASSMKARGVQPTVKLAVAS